MIKDLIIGKIINGLARMYNVSNSTINNVLNNPNYIYYEST